MSKSRITTDHPLLTINAILVANRGEIASRIIRSCRKMGIRSLAVFSEADREASFVEEADAAIFIGASSPRASYLDQDKIIAAAKKLGADAIHPGYGFLAEHAGFARRCAAEGLIFIGPRPEAIEVMGSKSKAKDLMEKHGIPVVPGYRGEDQRIDTLIEAAARIGYPLLLKATAGGGGKGMRIVREADQLEGAVKAAKREAMSAFGEDELILEKYIESGRHIEFQIFGDQHGNTIHLLERECSIQRRYQKVIEESPSPIMGDDLRARMGSAAVKAANALNYDNAGTVEFIYDDRRGAFYFLEVNTRLQVEHPVTEEITGLDLVQMQIDSAMGKPLALKQEEVVGKGYAIEARLYAEDPANDFLPVTGKILRFESPEVKGLRVETAIRSGSEISVFYDPMIAKLIVWDDDRATAHRKMQYVLRQLICLGMTTNQSFLLYLLEKRDFQEGRYDTHFIRNKIDLAGLRVYPTEGLNYAGIAATLHGWLEREESRTLLRSLPSGWRNSFYEDQQERFLVNEEVLIIRYRYLNDHFLFRKEDQNWKVRLFSGDEGHISFEADGLRLLFHMARKANSCFLQHEHYGRVQLERQERFPATEQPPVAGGYIAPMPSQIVRILVTAGQKVSAGEDLIVLSSMKMENTLSAAEDGIVEEVYAREGEHVEAGFLLIKLTTSNQPS